VGRSEAHDQGTSFTSTRRSYVIANPAGGGAAAEMRLERAWRGQPNRSGSRCERGAGEGVGVEIRRNEQDGSSGAGEGVRRGRCSAGFWWVCTRSLCRDGWAGPIGCDEFCRTVATPITDRTARSGKGHFREIGQVDLLRIWLCKAVFRSLEHSFRFWGNKKPAIFVRWFLFVFSFVFSGVCVVDGNAIL
jgi:hypothetical protein